MLTTLFKNILGITLSLTPIIFLLIAISPMLRKRYSPKLRYFIWLFVAARLLLPISFQNTARVVIPAGEAIYYLQNDSAAVVKAFAEAETTTVDEAAQGIQDIAAGSAISWIGILAMIWIVGVCAYLIWQAVSYFTIRRRFSRWSILENNMSTIYTFEEIKRELGIKKKIDLYKSEHISSPLLIGFIKPRIIIPTLTIEDSHLRGVLRHELLHFRRRDLWYKLLMMLTTALHWFNPAVYFMAKQAEMDIELACDADVLRGTDISSRKEYGFAILSLIRQEKSSHIPLTTYFFSSNKHMKQRFLGITDASRKRNGLPAFCISVAIVLISSVMIGCGYLTATPLAEVPNLNGPTASSNEVGNPPSTNLETSLVTLQPADNNENTTNMLVPDMQEMERLFLADLENNKAIQVNIQEDVTKVYEKTRWITDPYVGGEMVWPVPDFYKIISQYGFRFSGTDFHTGIDISGAGIYGQPVISVNDGTVAYINLDYKPGEGYGIYMIVDHGGGISTVYAQLSNVVVNVGDKIEKGQKIAEVGSTGWSTGAHLHFEVRVDGKHVGPQPYLTE